MATDQQLTVAQLNHVDSTCRSQVIKVLSLQIQNLCRLSFTHRRHDVIASVAPSVTGSEHDLATVNFGDGDLETSRQEIFAVRLLIDIMVTAA